MMRSVNEIESGSASAPIVTNRQSGRSPSRSGNRTLRAEYRRPAALHQFPDWASSEHDRTSSRPVEDEGSEFCMIQWLISRGLQWKTSSHLHHLTSATRFDYSAVFPTLINHGSGPYARRLSNCCSCRREAVHSMWGVARAEAFLTCVMRSANWER